MILKPTFTNGKGRHGGVNTVSSRIPPTVLSRIIQTKSSAEVIAALLNEAECSHSYRQTNSRAWSKFKVCYYSTVTGARSPLSPETVISALGAGHQYDAHREATPTRWNLWINR